MKGDPPIIRIYMNTWKEVLNFTKKIKPVCSKVKYPVMITIKWDGVVHRYDIYRNMYKEDIRKLKSDIADKIFLF